MPVVQSVAPISIFLQGQTFNTITLGYTAAHGASQIRSSPSWQRLTNFGGYTLHDENKILDAFDHSKNVVANATISNGDAQKAEDSIRVQIAPSIDQNHNNNENSSTNIEEQSQVSPHNYVHVTPVCDPEFSTTSHYTASCYLDSGLEALNQRRICVTCDVMIPAIGNLSNGFKDLNQVLADDFGMGMCKLGNACNLTNMKIDNFGEENSANKEFNRIFKDGSQKKLYRISKHM